MDIAYTSEAEKALRSAYYSNSGSFLAHSDSVNSARFNYDGTMIVSASSDNTIKVWGVSSFKELFSLEGHMETVFDAVFSPDDKIIVSASEDGTIKIWDIKGRQCIKTLPDHQEPVNKVKYSDDGKVLMSVSKHKVIVWNSDDWTQRCNVSSEDEIDGSDLFPISKKLVTASDRTINIWDGTTGDLIYSKEIPLNENILNNHSGLGKLPIYGVAISQDERMLVCTDYSLSSQSLLFLEDDSIAQFSAKKSGSIRSIAFGDNDRIVYSTISGEVYIYGIRYSYTYGMRDSTHPTPTIEKEYSIKKGEDVFVSFSKDGNSLVAGSSDGQIYVWSLYSMAKRFELQKAKGMISPSAYIKCVQGKILCADGNGCFMEWNSINGQMNNCFDVSEGLHTLSTDNNYRFISFSPRSVYSIGLFSQQIGDVAIYSTESKQLVKTIDSSSCATISAGGTMMACSHDEMIDLYDMQMWNVKKSLIGHSGYIYSLDFSPSGSNIVSAAIDGTAKVWDILTGSVLCELDMGGKPFSFRKPISHFSYNPDGKIISAIDDNNIVLWNSSTGKRLKTLIGHSGRVYDYSFSPNGKWIVSTSRDGTIKVWDVSSGIILVDLKPRYVRYHCQFVDNETIISVMADGDVEIYTFPMLQDLKKETRELFIENPLTSEERRKYHLE